MRLHVPGPRTENNGAHLCQHQRAGRRHHQGHDHQDGPGEPAGPAVQAEARDRRPAAGGGRGRKHRERGQAAAEGEPQHELPRHAALHAAAPRDYPQEGQLAGTLAAGKQNPQRHHRDAEDGNKVPRTGGEIRFPGGPGQQPVCDHHSVGRAVLEDIFPPRPPGLSSSCPGSATPHSPQPPAHSRAAGRQ